MTVNMSAFAQNNIISYRDDVLTQIRNSYLHSENQRRCWYATRTESESSNKTDGTELDIQKADCPELSPILLTTTFCVNDDEP